MKKTKTDVKTSLLDIVIEKSQIKDFIPIYKAENGTMMQTYWDYDYKINNKSLQFSQKFITLNENIVTAQYSYAQEKDLNRWGINIKEKLKSTLLEELSNNIKRNFINIIFNLASKNKLEFRISLYNRILKFINNIFGKDYKIYIEIKNNEDGYKKLKNFILNASNQIYQKGKWGPANYVICNTKIGIALNSFNILDIESLNKELTSEYYQFQKIGKIQHLNVFTDPMMSNNDNRILIGSVPCERYPGLGLSYLNNEIDFIEAKDNNLNNNINAIMYSTIFDCGKYPEYLYSMFEYKIVNDNWFIKILKKILK